MPLRFVLRFATMALCASALAACAAGDLSPGGPSGAEAGVTTPPPEAGAGSDASPDSTTGPGGGSDGGPGVFDGGPPAIIGPISDAASDAPVDAPVDAADARVCGPAGGSYTATCSGCSVTGNTLACNCQNASSAHTLVDASVDMCKCTQPPVIANSDGVLTCP